RTSRSNGEDADESLFSRMAVKVMSPEQLYDSLRAVVTPSAKPEDERPAAAANQGRRGAGNARAQFVAFFQSDDGADPTEYQGGIPQALRLMNSAEFIGGDKWLNGIIGASQSATQNIERLYLGAVSRRPSAEESQRLASYLSTHSSEPRKAYSD